MVMARSAARAGFKRVRKKITPLITPIELILILIHCLGYSRKKKRRF